MVYPPSGDLQLFKPWRCTINLLDFSFQLDLSSSVVLVGDRDVLNRTCQCERLSALWSDYTPSWSVLIVLWVLHTVWSVPSSAWVILLSKPFHNQSDFAWDRSKVGICDHSKRWITRLVGRWRTQLTVWINVNCRHFDHQRSERILR